MVSCEVQPAGDVSFAAASCAFGVFDGVHEGHRFIIQRAREDARARGGKAIIITFDRDPSELFCPNARDKLMGNDERLRALAAAGADGVAVVPFSPQVAAEDPDAFLDGLFAQGAPAALFVGEDVRFGRGARGTLADLERWGGPHGMVAQGVPLLERDGAPITSTRIRACVASGNVEEAADLLGHAHALEGRVVSGRQAGREMGICTANLSVDDDRLVPADGVYAAYADVKGARCKAAVSVGVPVTFDDATEATIEAHLLDFEDDLYGETLRLEFVQRLRPMIKFANTEELLAQIQQDIARTRALPAPWTA